MIVSTETTVQLNNDEIVAAIEEYLLKHDIHFIADTSIIWNCQKSPECTVLKVKRKNNNP